MQIGGKKLMNVYEKLIAIQSELKAPKSQYNNFGKYAYRNCEDILEALKPILKEHKSTIYISDEIVTVLERFYIKATVTFIDAETGEKITNTAYAREEENKKGMDGSQVTGASSSYARKYALNGMFAIDDTKDSDFTNTTVKGDNSALSEAQIKRLLAIASKVNISADDVKVVVAKKFGVQDLRKMNKQQYDEICSRLEKKGIK